MIEIIEPRKHINNIYYHFEFTYDDGSGFSFPCDSDGNINYNEFEESAKRNYMWCLNNPHHFKSIGIVKYDNSYVQPAIGKCSCGVEFELIDQYLGASQCPNCGQWYNILGQELIDPEYWEEDEGYFDPF